MKFLIVLFVNFLGALSVCPDEAGWFQSGSSCYLMSQDKMTWFAAQEVTTNNIVDSTYLCSFVGDMEDIWQRFRLMMKNQRARTIGPPYYSSMGLHKSHKILQRLLHLWISIRVYEFCALSKWVTEGTSNVLDMIRHMNILLMSVCYNLHLNSSMWSRLVVIAMHSGYR